MCACWVVSVLFLGSFDTISVLVVSLVQQLACFPDTLEATSGARSEVYHKSRFAVEYGSVVDDAVALAGHAAHKSV